MRAVALIKRKGPIPKTDPNAVTSTNLKRNLVTSGKTLLPIAKPGQVIFSLRIKRWLEMGAKIGVPVNSCIQSLEN